MDDMTAFERQLSGEIRGLMGPERPVDDLAVFDAIAATNPKKGWGFTMFTALRFVAAAAIVALFGGFMLIGVLTAPEGDETVPAAITGSPSPGGTEPPAAETTEGLLSTMVTEEVEPGVFRVVNDGHREVSHADEGYWNSEAVIVGDIGDVWRITPPRDLFRLGQEPDWSYDPGLVQIHQDNTEATRDGRLWTVAAPDGYRTFDGGSWNAPIVDFGEHFETLATQADGTVWLLAEDHLFWVLPSGDDADVSPSWKDAYGGDWVPPNLAVTDTGEAWLVGRGGSDNYYDFLRFDGDAWQVVSPPIATAAGPQAYFSWDVGPDGTLWAAGDALELHESLARLDEEGWTTFTGADGVRTWGEQPMGYWGTDLVRVAPDGSVWVNATNESTRTCDGLARFDGESWLPFLPVRCITDLDFAPDGSVWVVASDKIPGSTSTADTFVITPGAVTSQP